MASTSSASRMLSSCTCAFKRSVVRVQRHRIHTRPQLPYDLENGVQPFLSPKALHGTAVEWHQGTLSKLNDLTRGTRSHTLSPLPSAPAKAGHRTTSSLMRLTFFGRSL